MVGGPEINTLSIPILRPSQGIVLDPDLNDVPFKALLIAVEQGDLPNVQLAIKRGADINEIPWGMESVLMRAIRCRHSDVAEFLIEQGVYLGYHYEKASSPRAMERKPHETARDYAEFYKLPDIVQLIDTKIGYRR